jgi:putative nucleotidyltransferase with HDIG domain
MFTYSWERIDSLVFENKKDLLKLLSEHEYDTFIFSVRTAQLNAAIACEMGLNENDVERYFLCGLFHDVGKLGMAKEFINYPGAYTIAMYNEMKNHAAGGALLLEKANAPQEMIDTCRYHHSNFDGSGYPGIIHGKNIPSHARTTRVSDSVDAYMSKRCYKEGGPTREALSDLQSYSGTSYDPEIIHFFSLVHVKVMRTCHSYGIDHPSQDVYMHFLCENYPICNQFVPDFIPEYKKK